jgi:hypothetical protein
MTRDSRESRFEFSPASAYHLHRVSGGTGLQGEDKPIPDEREG